MTVIMENWEYEIRKRLYEQYKSGYKDYELKVRNAIEKLIREKKGYPVKLIDDEGYHLIRVIDLEKELEL